MFSKLLGTKQNTHLHVKVFEFGAVESVVGDEHWTGVGVGQTQFESEESTALFPVIKAVKIKKRKRIIRITQISHDGPVGKIWNYYHIVLLWFTEHE